MLLRSAALGLAGVGLAGQPLTRRGASASDAAETTTAVPADALHLTMRECLVEMVDQTPVYAWAYDTPQTGLRLPGPLIETVVGQPASIAVTNLLPRPRRFAIPGVADSGPIAPGATAVVEVEFDHAGTYIYLDPSDAPLARAMGLAGVLVVRPEAGEATPYNAATPAVRQLFADLGTTDHFPGHPWVRWRTWVWVFSSVDPVVQQQVRDEPDLSPADFVAAYHPRYFLLNGRTGYFASNDPSCAMHGRVGQPALVRVANIGMAAHSPHVHGNHMHVLAVDGQVKDNVVAHDTWHMPPLRTTDVLHPFTRPPDAHPWPPSDPSVWTTDLAGDGHTGMIYPMHCHTELALLANGGNYPQGLITHWALTGDLVEGPPQEEEPPDDEPDDDPPDDDPPDDDPPDEEPPDDPPGEEPPDNDDASADDSDDSDESDDRSAVGRGRRTRRPRPRDAGRPTPSWRQRR